MTTRVKKKRLTKAQIERFDQLVEELAALTTVHLHPVDDHYLKSASYLSERGEKVDRFFEVSAGDLTVHVCLSATRNNTSDGQT